MKSVYFVIILFAVAWEYYRRSTTFVDYCALPNEASLFDVTSSCFFSSNYQYSREQFIRESKAAGFELTALNVVDDLFIDVALSRGRSDAVLLHISGTHGSEGFIGSAIQRAILHHRNETLASSSSSSSSAASSSRPTVIFVHALNPYGMAHWRRFNEDNIDLNRNAIFDQPTWKLVLDRDPNLAGYEDLNWLMNPVGAPSYLQLLSQLPAILYQFTFNYRASKKALVTGTYTREKGLYFGGRSLAKSHRLLRDWLKQSGYLESARKLHLIDVHSGLGKPAHDTLMADVGLSDVVRLFSHDSKTAQQASVAARLDDVDVRTTPFVEASKDSSGTGGPSDGYENMIGGVTGLEGYVSLFANLDRKRSIAVTQEFGTVNSLLVVAALMRENQAFHYARNDVETMRSCARGVYDAFVPQTNDARTRVVRRGVVVFQQSFLELSKH